MGPPVPIPNTAVKLLSAYDTALARVWENRSLPRDLYLSHTYLNNCHIKAISRLCSQTITAIQYMQSRTGSAQDYWLAAPLSFKRKIGMLHCNQTQPVGELHTGQAPSPKTHLSPLSGPFSAIIFPAAPRSQTPNLVTEPA